MGDEVLPCGCLLRRTVEDGLRTLTIIPCTATCLNYRNALGLANEEDKPIEYREGP